MEFQEDPRTHSLTLSHLEKGIFPIPLFCLHEMRSTTRPALATQPATPLSRESERQHKTHGAQRKSGSAWINKSAVWRKTNSGINNFTREQHLFFTSAALLLLSLRWESERKKLQRERKGLCSLFCKKGCGTSGGGHQSVGSFEQRIMLVKKQPSLHRRVSDLYQHTHCQRECTRRPARYNICIRARGVKIKPEHYDCA